MNNNPICFFDSGIGGATILKEVIKKLPNENYVYLADSKNNPYGNKTKEELFCIVKNAVEKLLVYKPKIIVCACNTATTMVLDDIKNIYKDVLFVGVKPNIKEVYNKYYDKRSIILATKGTIESKKFKELYYKYKTPNSVLIKAPLLASLIENKKKTYVYLKSIIGKFKNIDIVVLGCTHYPLIKKEIKKILGNVIFIDSSVDVTNKISKLIKNNFNNKHEYIKVLSNNKSTYNRVLDILKMIS